MRPPALTHPSAAVFLGDCLDVLAEMPDDSVDAIVTDPPYGLGFMGKAWDDLPPGLDWAVECLRVLKPGGHLLAFGGTRTWHRLAVAVEDAGFEVRDSIAWLYGSGFPKSLDVSKAIDKAAGATREVVGFDPTRYRDDTSHSLTHYAPGAGGRNVDYEKKAQITAPATPAAQKWQGWGTALKPAFEPIVVARKPLVGTVAANVLAHGTGALNIDGTRVGDGHDRISGGKAGASASEHVAMGSGWHGGALERPSGGRWPANVLLDGDAAAELDGQSGTLRARGNQSPTRRDAESWFTSAGQHSQHADPGDTGGASRFFPVFRDDPEGPCHSHHDIAPGGGDGPPLRIGFAGNDTWEPCYAEPSQAPPALPTFRYQAKAPTRERPTVVAEDGTKTAHPTVKPLALMRWLVRLVTPPGGTVLDTFTGSGATIEAAIQEGFYAMGIEREADYLPLIQIRLDRVEAPESAA